VAVSAAAAAAAAAGSIKLVGGVKKVNVTIKMQHIIIINNQQEEYLSCVTERSTQKTSEE
jgi:hypothetical protein